MRNNPWLVTSVTDLSYYCCPECQYRSQNLEKFKIHALNNHARANDLFNRDDFSDSEDECRFLSTSLFSMES